MTETLLTYFSVLSPVVGIIIGFTHWLSLSKGVRYVLLLMLCSFASDVFMLLLANFGIRNLPVAHVYGLTEGIILLLYFRTTLAILPIAEKLLIPFIILYAADSILISGIFQFNAYARALESLMIIGLCIFSLYQVYDTESNIFIESAPQFWIIVALLVYFSGGLFSFLLATEILSASPDRFYGSWILHNISNASKNIILTMALWKVRLGSIQN